MIKDDWGCFRDDANSVSNLVGPVREDDAGKGAEMLNLKILFLSSVLVFESSKLLWVAESWSKIEFARVDWAWRDWALLRTTCSWWRIGEKN